MNETRMTFSSYLTYTTQEFAYRNRSECNKNFKTFSLLQYWHKPMYNFILSLPHASSSIFTHKFWNQSKTRKVTSFEKICQQSQHRQTQDRCHFISFHLFHIIFYFYCASRCVLNSCVTCMWFVSKARKWNENDFSLTSHLYDSTIRLYEKISIQNIFCLYKLCL